MMFYRGNSTRSYILNQHRKEMMLAMGIMVLLVAGAQAGAVVVMDCHPCGDSQYCFTLDGGPFSDYTSPPSTCNYSTQGYPFTTTWTTGSQCSSGCYVTESSPHMTTLQFCSTSSNGKAITDSMSGNYASIDPGQTYDWCNSSNDSLSGGAIAGIVIGCIAGVALVVGVIVYFVKCRSS